MVDYKGQELAEQIYYYLIIVVGAIAWIVGYVQQSFLITVYGWAGGVALAVLICVPNWPWFNRNPVEWLEKIPKKKKKKAKKVEENDNSEGDESEDSAAKKKKKKKKKNKAGEKDD
mmetsp:Transcript_48095/g.79952  ORF Transcript_48095/g.79952 Transcript_48095/m.79952 type:complete len:116 (-) Transcript_48095:241-588(-)